jgi:iron(III) transport system permease protein
MVRAAILIKEAGIQFKFNIWIAAWTILAAIFIGPILAVFFAATGDSGGLWSHLFDTVLQRYVANTLILMAGVAIVSLLIGVSSAWVVVRYDFFCRSIFQWMLLLPAAIPAYLIAYTYCDFFEFSGPLQKLLRDFFGWKLVTDYWFPEIRSMGGAIFLMGSVLYPYVYIMSRAAFLLTPASLYEVGLITQRSIFWKIGLPLARPAIAAGVALTMMETVSDFGTVEYFAIETLTLGIFNVWLGMNSLTTAAQISTFSFLFVISLLIFEVINRARQRYTDTTNRAATLPPKKITGAPALLCWVVCGMPIMFGFLIPVLILLSFVFQGYSIDFNESITTAAFNSLILAIAISSLVMASAFFMIIVSKFQKSAVIPKITAAASCGYAFPGTILAVGVAIAGGTLDDTISVVVEKYFNTSFSGFFASGIGLVVIACVIRFQAIGYGSITTGLGRIPENMMHANRALGRGLGYGIIHVIIPLIKLSFIAGGLLVFVDVMKELPITLLLRPFNFETLPTFVYQFAKDELLEEAALPALIIIATGLIPTIIMNSILNRFLKQ